MVGLASLLEEGVPATSVSPESLDVFVAVYELAPEACRPEAFLERLVCVSPFVRMQGKGRELSDEACAVVSEILHASGDDSEHWLEEETDHLNSHVHLKIAIVMFGLASLL